MPLACFVCLLQWLLMVAAGLIIGRSAVDAHEIKSGFLVGAGSSSKTFASRCPTGLQSGNWLSIGEGPATTVGILGQQKSRVSRNRPDHRGQALRLLANSFSHIFQRDPSYQKYPHKGRVQFLQPPCSCCFCHCYCYLLLPLHFGLFLPFYTVFLYLSYLTIPLLLLPRL